MKLFTLSESRRPTWILRHLKTCRHLLIFLNPFNDWLFAAGCLLLAADCLHAGYWALLVAPNCNGCEIYVFLWKMKPNKHQKPSKLRPKWPQNDTKWGPKSILWGSGRTFEGLGRPLHFFCHLLVAFLGPFWGYFEVKKLEKTIRILLNSSSGKRYRC